MGPQEVVDSESDVEVRDIVEITGDPSTALRTGVANPVIDTDFAARGAETRLAGKWYAILILAARAGVEGITAVWVAAKDHTLDGLADVGVLVCGDLVFDAQIAPGGR